MIFSEIGQPIIKAATRVSKGRSVPIREWTSKLRKRLKTDIPERERIAEPKSALAERFYEIRRSGPRNSPNRVQQLERNGASRLCIG